MKLLVFAVHDTKVNAFMPPFTMRSRGEAVRSFMDAVSDGQSSFCKHPEDFALWSLGEWDDGSGMFTSDVKVVMLAKEVQPHGELPE